MITIKLRNNFDQVIRNLENLPGELADKAVARALNAAADHGKLQMARQISQEFRLSVSQVKDRLAVKKASNRGTLRLSATLEATSTSKGRSMNMIAFASGTETAKAAKARLTATGGRGGSRAAVNAARQLALQIKRGGGKKIIPGAFIGNNGRTMFIRTGRDRLPIKALNTIDVPQMFNTRRINEVVVKAMLDKFGPVLRREIGAVMRGFLK